MFKSNDVERLLRSKSSGKQEMQSLCWVLQIIQKQNDGSKVQHRTRLVSASLLSQLRYSLADNSSTVVVCTVGMLLSLVPIRKRKLPKEIDRLTIRVKDVSKAYLRADPTKRLIVYKPPVETLGDEKIVRKAGRQQYVEEEAWR